MKNFISRFKSLNRNEPKNLLSRFNKSCIIAFRRYVCIDHTRSLYATIHRLPHLSFHNAGWALYTALPRPPNNTSWLLYGSCRTDAFTLQTGNILLINRSMATSVQLDRCSKSLLFPLSLSLSLSSSLMSVRSADTVVDSALI